MSANTRGYYDLEEGNAVGLGPRQNPRDATRPSTDSPALIPVFARLNVGHPWSRTPGVEAVRCGHWPCWRGCCPSRAPRSPTCCRSHGTGPRVQARGLHIDQPRRATRSAEHPVPRLLLPAAGSSACAGCCARAGCARLAPCPTAGKVPCRRWAWRPACSWCCTGPSLAPRARLPLDASLWRGLLLRPDLHRHAGRQRSMQRHRRREAGAPHRRGTARALRCCRCWGWSTSCCRCGGPTPRPAMRRTPPNGGARSSPRSSLCWRGLGAARDFEA